tara:strand:- start:111 stop:479 length:369 start_codon:yes stop_codon:yes gene_type:complete
MLNYARSTPSQEFLNELYEYESSDKTFPLRFKNTKGRRVKGMRPGRVLVNTHRNDYYQTQIPIGSGNYYTMSRIVWKFHYGTEPTGVIDHINGDSTDNRIENLQDITQKQNLNKKAGEVITA